MGKLRVQEFGELHVPAWVVDHPSFLKWLRSGAVPEDVRIGYINNQVWTETMPERAFPHNQIKMRLSSVLGPLADENRSGVFFCDGMTFTSEAGGFTSVPDGIFVCRKTIDDGLVQLTGGRRSHHDTELTGIPDLVIEVVSDSSEYKDTEWLMANYWNAEVSEYWLIDGREEPLRFTIYRRGEKGFVAVRRSEGWNRSAVLERSFRFVAGPEEMGFPTYRFEVR
ncbi:MAG: Uma2 family endonuclease [Planctomycetes bacterium]|nr:Uma2 family endonuclease [Planctomycetota bacterium]